MRGKYATKKHPLTRVAISEGGFRMDKGSDQKTLTRRKPYPRGVERFNPAPPICLEYLVEVFAEKYDA